MVRAAAGGQASDELCAAVYAACGGNPLYLSELLRAADLSGRPLAALRPSELVAGGLEGIARQVINRVNALGPGALGLAQALAVLGDDCELRHAAAIAGVTMTAAARLAGGLVNAEVLTAGDRPRFVHPVIRDAVEASLDSAGQDRAHRRAARLLHADAAPPGQVAAHLHRVRPAGDGWVLARLREAARAAMGTGAPQAAAGLLDRALAEPPPPSQRAGVLREAARAQVAAGWQRTFVLLEDALIATADPRERAAVALEAAEAYAALFRWADAVDVIERALAELNGADQELAARLEGELVVCGLHDARRADRVAPVLTRLGSRVSQASEPHAVAQGMRMLLAGQPAGQIAALLEQALEAAGPEAENWDTRAALLWVLVVAERFGTVETSLTPLLAQVHRGGSARGFVAATPPSACSNCGSERCRRPTRRRGWRCGCCRKATSRRGSDSPPPSCPISPSRLASSPRRRRCWTCSRRKAGRRVSQRCSSRPPAAACGWLRAAPPTRWPTSTPARRCSAPTRGACRSARPAMCTPAPALRSHCCGWASATKRTSWPMLSWPTSGRSARRARSGSRCVPPDWPAAGGTASHCFVNQRLRSITRPRCSSAPARSPNSGPPCAGSANAPQPAIRWPGRWSSPSASARGHWPPRPATSSRPPAPARGVPGVPGRTR